MNKTVAIVLPLILAVLLWIIGRGTILEWGIIICVAFSIRGAFAKNAPLPVKGAGRSSFTGRVRPGGLLSPCHRPSRRDHAGASRRTDSPDTR